MWAERYDRPDKDLLARAARDRERGRRRGAAAVRGVRSGRAGSADRGPGRLRSLPARRTEGSARRSHARSAGDCVATAMTAMAQAADLFRSAIATDPKFAQAHASLAQVLLNQAMDRIDEASNARAGRRVRPRGDAGHRASAPARPEERRRIFREGPAPQVHVPSRRRGGLPSRRRARSQPCAGNAVAGVGGDRAWSGRRASSTGRCGPATSTRWTAPTTSRR